MEKFYTVVRINYKGQTETHSVEQKETLEAAQKRWFRVLDTDFNDDAVTWCAAYLIDSDGNMMESRVFDKTGSEV